MGFASPAQARSTAFLQLVSVDRMRTPARRRSAQPPWPRVFQNVRHYWRNLIKRKGLVGLGHLEGRCQTIYLGTSIRGITTVVVGGPVFTSLGALVITEGDPSCHVPAFMTLLPEPRIAEDIPQCVAASD